MQLCERREKLDILHREYSQSNCLSRILWEQGQERSEAAGADLKHEVESWQIRVVIAISRTFGY